MRRTNGSTVGTYLAAHVFARRRPYSAYWGHGGNFFTEKDLPVNTNWLFECWSVIGWWQCPVATGALTWSAAARGRCFPHPASLRRVGRRKQPLSAGRLRFPGPNEIRFYVAKSHVTAWSQFALRKKIRIYSVRSQTDYSCIRVNCVVNYAIPSVNVIAAPMDGN